MKNSLKTKFKNRELIYGGWVSYSDPSIAETFALAGFDFVAIDMDNGPTLHSALKSPPQTHL